MSSELLTILEYIEQERGISREVLVQAVEKALLTASRKSIHPAKDLAVKIDRSTGDIRAWAMLEIVENNPDNNQLLYAKAKEKFPDVKLGDIVEWEVTPENFGRIAAQTAKQAIMQQLRKAEKEIVKEEFIDKVGQILNGTVHRFEAGNIIIDFQKAEGLLSVKEKVHGEQYMSGDRINALLLKVDTTGVGPSLIVSRTHPNFVKKLFEREVSEIHDGVVEIVAIARESGSRTKIAVRSKEQRVDAVGACVGMRGMRVKNITNELSGERIDIIPFEEDIRKYATNALQPAKILSVDLIPDKKSLIIHVTPDQSRLAFGKKAQNVRLASKLLGWTFNIEVTQSLKIESIEEKIKKAISNLSTALDISLELAQNLVNHGFITVDGLRAATREQLTAIDGISPEEADRIYNKLESEELL